MLTSSTAAESFVETYYPALNNPKLRSTLASFYVKSVADITLNGNKIADPAQLQSIYETQVERTRYEVGSFDCQVINTNYNFGLDESKWAPTKDGSKMSIIVMVSGSVEYFKEETEGERRGFMDNVVLVPNWEAQKPNAAKGLKKWLVQSQTFRLVM